MRLVLEAVFFCCDDLIRYPGRDISAVFIFIDIDVVHIHYPAVAFGTIETSALSNGIYVWIIVVFLLRKEGAADQCGDRLVFHYCLIEK